ncbi:MAG: hypothetical protein BA872_09945 [Desulfobacterales bacterium C00003060]|nr:MAG: hypothetical protein BA861_12805 [Desulfobacterales bacterium S3730MH5]OEU77554.1 MAG: hypothetical protein BA872_09945 [Desulfobacterales bacterium C00003060]OEU84990.1 MAG: hypothetical protein BA865_05465 [Desulfobacterales bacterium S5133MH4]
MELKSLFLGLTFAIGIFALKNGVGLHYYLNQKRRLKEKVFFLFLYCLVYFLVFVISFQILQRINILLYFEIVQDLLKSGMFIHIMMAGGLIIWGIVLLKGKNRTGKRSYGWMALVIPCPVCITVIFFSVAFLLSCLPDPGYPAVLGAYVVFMAIVVATVISMTLWSIRSGFAAESILGAAMLIVAVYFFLSVIIMPQFADIEKIYRLAAYEGEKQTVKSGHIVLLYSMMAALFTIGFWTMRRQIRMETKWT